MYSATVGGRKYAFKKYVYLNHPLHLTTIREIKSLRLLSHPNIIPIEEIIVDRGAVWAVFPFCESDLSRLIHLKQGLSLDECRGLFRQIVEGVRYMHSKNIIHRDLKSANILIDKRSSTPLSTAPVGSATGTATFHRQPASPTEYISRICDFGMAKPISKDLTPGVVTLWYRAPELLLGATRYGTEVDVWSLGCILAEMLTGRSFFRGSTEVEQLEEIIAQCGSVSIESMPQAEEYPLFSKYKLPLHDRSLAANLSSVDRLAVDLLDGILTLDPAKRSTIDQILAHPFFSASAQ